MKRSNVAVIVGTRPEAIKLAPVIQALHQSTFLRPTVLSTSQHRELVGPALAQFKLRIDHDLNIMRPGQKLWDLSGRLVQRLGAYFAEHPADAVFVQGDTTSAFCGGLTGFYHQIKVGHVEAGLRTGDRYAPFPEEMNRALLTRMATWHFAPTPNAVRSLRREGIDTHAIHLTGNTVVDAMRWMAAQSHTKTPPAWLGNFKRGQKLILVTCHRRENFGAPLQGVVQAILQLARKNPKVTFVFPVHPNPQVHGPIHAALRNIENVVLTKPLDYNLFLACLKKSFLVMSDSGGVQEEATALGKPVLVLRENSERPEGIKAGNLKLVGTDPLRIERTCQRLLDDPVRCRSMARASQVFGDGKAARRIVGIVEDSLTGGGGRLACW